MEAEELYKPNRDLTLLYPPFAEAVKKGLADCHLAGLNIHAFEGFRLTARQAYLYAQGRSTPGNILTNSAPEMTWHEYGVAVDLAFGGPGKWSWDGPYYRVGEIMLKQPGLVWLGAKDSKFTDPPHFQMTFGLKVEDMRRIKRQGGIKAVFERFDKARVAAQSHH